MIDYFKLFFAKKAILYGLNSLRKINTSQNHPELQKSRDGIKATEDAQALRLNNDLIASYVKTLKAGVVGEGTTLQYKSDDVELNKKVERWLERWSEVGNCSIREILFRQEAERNMVAEAAVRGGFIIRHHWDKRFKTLYNFEIISCDNIDRTKNNFSEGLYFGTQTTSLGKIDGLWLYVDQNRTTSKYVKMKKGSTPNITLFLDIWTDPHQYTNITPLAAILNTLDRLASYESAEIKGAKGRAEKSIIIETPVYEMMIEAQKQVIEQTKTSADKIEAQKILHEMLQEFTPTGFHEGATPVMPGSKVWDLKADGNTIYADINENSKQILSRALGLAPSTVAGIPESSYNVALKNAQADEREYAIMAQMLVEKVLKPIYRSAVEAGYLLGKYDLPNYYELKEDKYDFYLKITRKRLGHIDPLKQALGDESEIAAGLESHISKITAKGRDPEDVIDDEIKYETMRKEKFEKAGLVYIQSGTDKIKLEETKRNLIVEDSKGA
jgi:capsid protein